MKKLIVFLIRKKLGLKKNQTFRFGNQKSDAVYYFTDTDVMKRWLGVSEPSRVSLNWLLNDECHIIKFD